VWLGTRSSASSRRSWQLQKLVPEAEIEVFESDLNVIQLACAFANVKEIIDNEHTRVIYDPKFNLLAERIAILSEDEAFFLHYPSFLNLKDQAGKEIIKAAAPWTSIL
jgi:hypothetical protein